jgi:hypothetical protein
MIRSGHTFYDLREIISSPKLLLPLLVVAGIFTFVINFQCIYGFALLYVALFAARAMIGPRCPHCDSPLHEVEAERDRADAFTLYILWRCPRDGYEEKEPVKGGSGLFGGN